MGCGGTCAVKDASKVTVLSECKQAIVINWKHYTSTAMGEVWGVKGGRRGEIRSLSLELLSLRSSLEVHMDM